MIQFRAAVTMLLLLLAACLGAGDARAQSTIAAPGTSGDQLLFFYDATGGRTTFLVVSNLSPASVTLDIAWYAQDLTGRVATQRQTLAAGANVILDPSQVQGVSGNAGITVVTPVVPGSDGRPVVPEPVNDSLASAASGPLVGGFTLADLSSGSAFGQNPLARIAVTADGKRAAAGSVVDGATVRYQRIAPDALTIPFYFNPRSAGFTNRAILGAFEDRYATDNFSIGPASVDLQVGLIDSAGADVASSSITVSGVQFTDVQTLADATRVTSSGKVLLGITSPLPESARVGSTARIASIALARFASSRRLTTSARPGSMVTSLNGTCCLRSSPRTESDRLFRRSLMTERRSASSRKCAPPRRSRPRLMRLFAYQCGM